MSEEKKEGCCGTQGSCCAGKKLLIGLLAGALIFAAGMWFAKAQCRMGAKMCPISGAPMERK
ncbi:MAG: hypothetical protein HY591_02085 [Candidatus Omnitrophica bacterium]|nr:hypothetical protein [Candidatus Omnitrophota bacterium]